jgi:hypothetical protein
MPVSGTTRGGCRQAKFIRMCSPFVDPLAELQLTALAMAWFSCICGRSDCGSDGLSSMKFPSPNLLDC